MDRSPGALLEKFKTFKQLHQGNKLLMLPNIWDPIGAILLESMDFPAVATASASIAYSKGFLDGEQLSFEEMLSQIRKIANSVSIPVTADIESGYADSEELLKTHVLKLLEAGIAGINIEDTDKKTNRLIPAQDQANRIKVIKQTAAATGGDLFVNARTDVYIHGQQEAGQLLQETLERGTIYKQAGADCFYPITVTDSHAIGTIVDTLQMPVNILAITGIPDLPELEKMGIARISLGPGFLKTAIQAMKKLAEKLKNNAGLEDIIGNEISSDYLKSLVVGRTNDG